MRHQFYDKIRILRNELHPPIYHTKERWGSFRDNVISTDFNLNINLTYYGMSLILLYIIQTRDEAHSVIVHYLPTSILLLISLITEWASSSYTAHKQRGGSFRNSALSSDFNSIIDFTYYEMSLTLLDGIQTKDEVHSVILPYLATSIL